MSANFEILRDEGRGHPRGATRWQLGFLWSLKTFLLVLLVCCQGHLSQSVNYSLKGFKD